MSLPRRPPRLPLAALAAALALRPAFAQVPAEPPGPPNGQSTQSTARALLSADDPHSRQAITAVLRPRPTDTPVGAGPGSGLPDDQAALVREIAGFPSAPPWLLEPLAALLQATPPERRGPILAAVGSIRTRDAVRVLLAQVAEPAAEAGASNDASGAIAEGAFKALGRLTGRTDLSADTEAWRDWFARVEWIPEAEWRRTLADALAGRADELGRERDRSISRLVDALRREYLAIPGIDGRSLALARWMRDELPQVRRMAFTMALQEVANARAPDGAVAQAALDCLGDPAPEFRRSAAELLAVLAPPDVGQRLARALDTETDPTVAAPLLRAVARWPDVAPRLRAITWLAAGEPTQRPAATALLAMHERGLIPDPQDQGRIASALRRTPPDALSTPCIRLLYAYGEDTDRSELISLLTCHDPARRVAAADALASEPAALDPLLAAARADPTLFPTASRAVELHRPTLAGYLAVAALPSPGPETRPERLAAIAARLDHADLLAAARLAESPTFREALLSRLATEPLPPAFGPGHSSSHHPAAIAGLLLLAQTRLDLGQPAASLAALDALAPAWRGVRSPEYAALRLQTLLWLGRLEEASDLEAGADAWLDGLERSIALPHASKVADAIESRFEGRLRTDQADRFAALKARLVPQSQSGPR